MVRAITQVPVKPARVVVDAASITEALRLHNGDRQRAADARGLSRTTPWRQLKAIDGRRMYERALPAADASVARKARPCPDTVFAAEREQPANYSTKGRNDAPH